MSRIVKFLSHDHGQSAVEYVGLLLLVAVLFSAGIYLGIGTWLGDKMSCVLLGRCREAHSNLLDPTYGAELAATVRRYTPGLEYAPGTYSLPTDFRDCRSLLCSGASGSGNSVTRTRAGQKVTAFTRVLDRRGDGGKLHIQYWLYYPETKRGNLGDELEEFYKQYPWAEGSELALLTKGKAKLGKRVLLSEADDARRRWKKTKVDTAPARTLARWLANRHRDSWQSYEVAIDRDGRADQRTTEISSVLKTNRYSHCLSSECRRSSHSSQWWVSVGKDTHEMRVEHRPETALRRTPDSKINLVPLESLSNSDLKTKFDQLPPWRRPVYRDPDDDGDHALRPGEERGVAEKVYKNLTDRPTSVDDAEEAGRRAEEQLKRAMRHEVSEEYASCKILLGDICDW